MLEAQGLHKTYNHGRHLLPVLKGIDLKVREGDVLAIVGPSGAGKSTLLHILGGLDKPDKGKITFEGQDIYKLNDMQRAKFRNESIGFIFQFYHLLPEFTALENVILPALVKGKGLRIKVLEQKGLDLLRRVGLEQRAKHKPHELSGGEQQRVAIARSLMNMPKIIFCDEPTGNLDSENEQIVIDLLMELNEKNHQTLVIVTHDENISSRAKRVVHIKDGKFI